MVDYNTGYNLEQVGPAMNAAAVTPSATELPAVSRAIYVGTAGNLVVTMRGIATPFDSAPSVPATVTFSNVPAGTVLPIRVTHVLTGTTAGNILNLF